eukprot:2559614-Amphidinium_carterae.3
MLRRQRHSHADATHMSVLFHGSVINAVAATQMASSINSPDCKFTSPSCIRSAPGSTMHANGMLDTGRSSQHWCQGALQVACLKRTWPYHSMS